MTLATGMFFLAGCGKTWKYDVGMANKSTIRLDDAGVLLDGKDAGMGILIPNSTKEHSDFKIPIPAKAKASFRTPDGVWHEQEVDVLSVVPKGFEGKLYFVIQPDLTVVVKPIPYDRYYTGEKP